MSSNIQRPKVARGHHWVCCLVQQFFAKPNLEVGIGVAHHHQAGDSSTAINADFSILEVVNALPFQKGLLCGRANVALFIAANEEQFSSVWVFSQVKACILRNYKLPSAHSVDALNVIALCHNCLND